MFFSRSYPLVSRGWFASAQVPLVQGTAKIKCFLSPKPAHNHVQKQSCNFIADCIYDHLPKSHTSSRRFTIFSGVPFRDLPKKRKASSYFQVFSSTFRLCAMRYEKVLSFATVSPAGTISLSFALHSGYPPLRASVPQKESNDLLSAFHRISSIACFKHRALQDNGLLRRPPGRSQYRFNGSLCSL